MNVVVDASVATKWFLFEEGSEIAASLLLPEHRLFAPDIVATEVVGVLLSAARQQRIVADAVRDAWRTLNAAVVRMPVDGHLVDAFNLAHEHGGKVTDALYVITARGLSHGLVTADSGQRIQAERAGVKMFWLADGATWSTAG